MAEQNRRELIGSLAALAIAVPPLARAASESGANQRSSAVALTALSVRVTMDDGSVHDFLGSAATDLGDYAYKSAFVQRNTVVRDAAIPMTIFFRPDSTSSRVEVVFEWGNVFSPPPTTATYKAEIFVNGELIHTVDVAKHYWLTRWRYQSEARPVLNSVSELRTSKLIPPYARVHDGQRLPKPAPSYTGPMSTSNMCVYMPTTGERGDIGVYTEYQAAYVATEDAAMLDSVLAWAEASGSCPWHVRDPKSQSPLDFRTYPKANFYYDQSYSTPKLAMREPSPNPKGNNPVVIVSNHLPALTHLPFMLTGDLYFLEAQQFATNFAYGASPPQVSSGILSYSESRDFAWSIRNLFFTISATSSVNYGGGLLPLSYFQNIEFRNRIAFMTNFVTNPAPKVARFFSATAPQKMGFWQEDYLAFVLGIAVFMGFEEWRPAFEWKIRSDIARTDGASGWPRSRPSLYYAEFHERIGTDANGRPIGVMPDGTIVPLSILRNAQGNPYAGTTTLDPRTGKAYAISPDVAEIGIDQNTGGDAIVGPVCKDWSALAARNGIALSGDGHIDPNQTLDYLGEVRTVLSLAANKLSVVAAVVPFNWLNEEVISRSGILPPWRWSI